MTHGDIPAYIIGAVYLLAAIVVIVQDIRHGR